MDVKNGQNKISPLFLKGETLQAAYYGYTYIGGRDEDQDFLACKVANGHHLFIVCDGMGGHAGGCVASETAAKALLESFCRQPEIIPTKEAIITAVNAANTAVFNKSQEEPRLRGMGTTLTLLVVDDEAAYVTHIGDSRVYQLRNGHKIFRTFDHSLVFDLVAKGHISEEDARNHPRSNVLSKAVGIFPEVEVDVTKLGYLTNDRFVLCCDGVWNSQPEVDIINMFTEYDELETTVLTTQLTIEGIGRKNGGHHDNHTMIVVDMKTDSKYKGSLFYQLKRCITKSI